jgi:FtsP/CotA-like multicopper oxidase with cupredoxin domain
MEIEIPGGSVLPYKIEGKNKVFHLVVSAAVQEIFNIDHNEINQVVQAFNQSSEITDQLSYRSQVVKGYGYNGTIPGPAIVVTQGDYVKIVVENKLPISTSIHFLGLGLPYNDDGIKKTFIKPGETETYEFQITQPQGTYVYESGYHSAIQLGMGLSGLFIVLPKDGDDIDRDFGFILQEWDISQDGDVRPLSTDCTWFTMNGHTAPNIPILKVSQGDRVRLRFANTSGISDSPMVLHGFAFNITGTEGGPVEKNSNNLVAIVVISPGTTRTVEFVAHQTGLWRLACSIYQKTVNNLSDYVSRHDMTAISLGGMVTFVEVLPKTPVVPTPSKEGINSKPHFSQKLQNSKQSLRRSFYNLPLSSLINILFSDSFRKTCGNILDDFPHSL